MVQLEVCTVSNRTLGKIQVESSACIKDVKTEISKLNKKLYVERQSIRNAAKGKDIKDSATIASLNIVDGSKVFVKDLGPQISWRFVFLVEYLGPLVVYLLFSTRPWLIYGYETEEWVFSNTAQVALMCWSLHYAKRLLETIFVHRFSHSTMPMLNLFKNSGYYWGFAAYVAYHTNHPLFTPPPFIQYIVGLLLFFELGNLSIHLLLRDLRPPGTKVRKIPLPDSNPLTLLFNFVSCPNYTYEFLAWLGFSIMTSCVPALIFTAAGMFQMSIWAINKHKAYKKEFSNYPSQRKAIIPFIL